MFTHQVDRVTLRDIPVTFNKSEKLRNVQNDSLISIFRKLKNEIVHNSSLFVSTDSNEPHQQHVQPHDAGHLQDGHAGQPPREGAEHLREVPL